jgi:hypothetical protein
MAMRQTGQCWIGGRGDDGMAAQPNPADGFYQLSPRVRWSAQYNVAIKATKAASIRLTAMTSVGIARSRINGRMLSREALRGFDPDQTVKMGASGSDSNVGAWIRSAPNRLRDFDFRDAQVFQCNMAVAESGAIDPIRKWGGPKCCDAQHGFSTKW